MCVAPADNTEVLKLNYEYLRVFMAQWGSAVTLTGGRMQFAEPVTGAAWGHGYRYNATLLPGLPAQCQLIPEQHVFGLL